MRIILMRNLQLRVVLTIREHHTEGKPTSDDPARKLPLEDNQVRLLSG